MRDPRFTVPEPPQGDVLRRQRLLDFLYENIDHPLQLICAPAGYGKTTMLADFARDTDLTVCWYSVDPLDSDPTSFILHLIEAVKSRFPALYDSSESPLELHQELSRSWQSLAGRLLDWIRERVPEYFVLAIDDFHIVSNKSGADDLVDFLLQRVPDNCRLIIASRETPQLASLPRLISQRKVCGLGPTELKFTSAEIKSLLQKNFGLDVTEDEAHRMEEESEGWITSILLTTHTLWSGLFKEALINRGPNSLLFDYMASEVFARETPSVQQFLLSTSVCHEFTVELANVLTGMNTSVDILNGLENRNLFISRLGGANPWYRYHHLFRDFLLATLRKDNSDRFASLNIKAAQYYLSINSPRQAIQHYIQGSEFSEALDLLEAECESLSHEGLWETLRNWMEQVPEDVQCTRPKLLLYLSRAYQVRGRNDDAIRMLNQAIQMFNETGDYGLEAQALVRRSVSLRFIGAYHLAVKDSRAALRLARKSGTIIDQAVARSHLGSALAQQGSFLKAEKEFRAAMDGYQQHGDLFQQSEIHKFLGLLYSELGDSARAVTHHELSRQGWQKLGNKRELSVTLNNMAYLYYQQGQYETAEPLAMESISLAQTVGSPRDEAYALHTLADIQREQGEYAEALMSGQRCLELAGECMESHLVCYVLITNAETYRLAGDVEKAGALLEQALALANEGGQDFELGLGLTCSGIIEYESRRYSDGEVLLKKACQALTRSGQKRAPARAHLHLAQALFLSRKYADALDQTETVAVLCGELGYQRFVAQEGRGMYPLLEYAAARCKSKDFFARLLGQIQGEPSPPLLAEPTQGPPVPRPAVMSPRLDVHAMGALNISMDGNLISSSTWGSSKAREMFLFMLYHGQPVHKEKIVEALWPEISSAKVNSNFHSTLYRIRAALYPNCVDRDGEVYRLNPSWTYQFDTREFETLLMKADRIPEDSQHQEKLLGSAIELYQGPFAEDIDSEWCNELRTDLEFRFLRAVSTMAEHGEAKGEYQKSISLLETALAVDDHQEEIYYKIMDLYVELGDPGSANRVYRKCLSVIGETDYLAESPKVKRLLAHLN